MLITLLACDIATDLFSSSKTVDETPTLVIEPWVTETPPARSIQPCLISSSDEQQLDTTSSILDMPQNILQFLNAGGNLSDLETALEAANMTSSMPPILVREDFTWEGYYDIALILIDPEPDFMPSGTLIIYQCQLDRYDIPYQSPLTEESGVPAIYSSADLNADTYNDLLVGYQTCGAHTCFERLEMISWTGRSFENLLGGSSADIPSPTIEVFPMDSAIKVTAGGIGSVGAGPFRRFVRTWEWNSDTGSFLPAPDEFLPSPFRIHLLHDADQAVKERNYDSALTSYSEVINADALQDWADPVTEREVLGAYASFRLIHTYLLIADTDSAEAAYNDLITNYPPASLGYAFAQMGEVFWGEYQASSDIISACVSAQAFANSHQETVINSLYFGYANPVYTAEDICPISN
jgi:hypothetical protein